MELAITHLGRSLVVLQGEMEGVENSGVAWTCTMLAAFLIAVTKHIIEQLQLGRVMAAHGGYSPGRTLFLGWGKAWYRNELTSHRYLWSRGEAFSAQLGFGFSFFQSRTAASGMALTTLSPGFSLLMKAPWKYPQSCCQRCVSQVTSNLAKLTLKMNHPSSWFIDLLRKHWCAKWNKATREEELLVRRAPDTFLSSVGSRISDTTFLHF